MKKFILPVVLAFLGFVVHQSSAQTGAPSITAMDGKLIFKIGDKVVTNYHHGKEVAKPYFWPMVTVTGNRVTRDWPMIQDSNEAKDHKHQKSAWFCHGDVIPEGLELKQRTKNVEGVDFWSEETNHGKIVCVKVGPVTSDKGIPTVSTLNEWRTTDGTVIMTEKRDISLENAGNGYLIRIHSELIASNYPITFGDTKEGSMGVRVRDSVTEKDNKGGKLTNAQGLQTEKALWGKESAWCDYSGPCDKGTAGITIFSDPKNAYSTAWHSRGYGLMAANPFGRNKSGFPDRKGNSDLVKIARGNSLKLGFALYVHDGDEKEAKAEKVFANSFK